MNKILVVFFLSLLCVFCFDVRQANAQTYTTDPRLGDFTSQVSSYGTFSNFGPGSSLAGPTFTPTSAELASQGFYVWNGGPVAGLAGSNWLLVSFSGPVSSILIFPNIDHPGVAFDGYQYSIAGSNDSLSWTSLFDATSVGGTSPAFTISGFTGTAPTMVNNIVNGGCSSPLPPVVGCVGYETLFNFGTTYRYYAFGPSTEAYAGFNDQQELSAVGAVGAITTPTPEPGSMVLIGTGLCLIAGRPRRVSKP